MLVHQRVYKVHMLGFPSTLFFLIKIRDDWWTECLWLLGHQQCLFASGGGLQQTTGPCRKTHQWPWRPLWLVFVKDLFSCPRLEPWRGVEIFHGEVCGGRCEFTFSGAVIPKICRWEISVDGILQKFGRTTHQSHRRCSCLSRGH